MADIFISKNTTVKLSDEEVDALKKAYDILQDIQTELWKNDADETETFTNVLCASEYIYMFMKEDIGINIDEKRL